MGLVGPRAKPCYTWPQRGEIKGSHRGSRLGNVNRSHSRGALYSPPKLLVCFNPLLKKWLNKCEILSAVVHTVGTKTYQSYRKTSGLHGKKANEYCSWTEVKPAGSGSNTCVTTLCDNTKCYIMSHNPPSSCSTTAHRFYSSESTDNLTLNLISSSCYIL